MKKLAIILIFLLIPTSPTLAQNSQESTIRADDDCAKLARACTGAARELKAARGYIEGLKQIIAAHDARIEIARKEIETLKEIGALESERAAKLEAAIVAEREAKDALLGKIALMEKRIKQLEGQAKRWRKFALITGTAAVVGLLVAIAK